ncbi:MAG: tRNA-dihydrouridine synthase family protein [Roseburia sp.]|nr:tRNA-dihydrouridine synthase family protein [Roseburia sp.]
MQFYMAPMEGLTGYVYRNAYHRHFHNIDKYFTPFLTNRNLNHKEINDILPEHNAGMQVVPQILTNRAEDFLCIAKVLAEYGYHTVNLNLGCPSGTVVTKHRGAGFLAVPEELDAFLEEIFAGCPLNISIKTRIGMEHPQEWERLMAIYEKYPLEELIIHPRVQSDFYKNTPHYEVFGTAMEGSRHSLCYNGDIYSVEDYRGLVGKFPKLEKVMLGRGILTNPGLVGAIRGTLTLLNPTVDEKITTLQACVQEMPDRARRINSEFVPSPKNSTQEIKGLDKDTLRAFLDDILHGYTAVMSGDRNTLFKMKELWVYLGHSFTNPEKYMKKIKKAECIAEYETMVNMLFREQDLIR